MEFMLRISCGLSPHHRDEECKQTYDLFTVVRKPCRVSGSLQNDISFSKSVRDGISIFALEDDGPNKQY
jgi:hypothetical protein